MKITIMTTLWTLFVCFLAPNLLYANCDQTLAIPQDLQYSTYQEIIPGIQRKLFFNRQAALPELKFLIEELNLNFQKVQPETTEEVANYLSAVVIRDEEMRKKVILQSKVASESLVEEFLKLRQTLYKHLQKEINLLIKHPRSITYERYTLLGYRASIAMTRLPDLATVYAHGIHELIYKLRQEMAEFNLPTIAAEDLPMEEWEKTHYRSGRQRLMAVLFAAPYHINLWSMKNFTVEDLVDAYDDHICLSQLILNVGDVPAEAGRTQSDFFDHDIFHCFEYLKHENQLNWLSKMKSKKKFDALKKERIAFKAEVRKAILQIDPDVRIFYILWYEMFHERHFVREDNFTATPESVLRVLKTKNIQPNGPLLSSLTWKIVNHYGVSKERASQMANIGFESLLQTAEKLKKK